MTSVLIIDDHPIVLQGCRRAFSMPASTPCSMRSDVVSGYRLYRRHRPDVVIVDLAMQGNGLAGLAADPAHQGRTIRARASWCSACTATRSSSLAPSEAGASGYVHQGHVLARAGRGLREGPRRARPTCQQELAMQVALVGTGARPRSARRSHAARDGGAGAAGRRQTLRPIADELEVSYKTVVNTCSQLKRS